MPTMIEILRKRRLEDPRGERFGFAPRFYDKHGRAQIVERVIAVLSDGRFVLDQMDARVFRTEKGDVVFDRKLGRRIVDPRTTEVR